jgi:hypothetical protein
MAQVNIGAIKFNWKGPYNNSIAYVVDDVVSSGGSSYVCILASQGNAVSSGTYWQVMSQAGTNGTDADLLSIGSTTGGDIYYNSGSAIARLAKGTAGQVLQMNSGATAPEYADASGGKIGAVVHAIKKDGWNNTNANQWTEVPGYNLTITPTKAGSTILAMGHISSGSQAGGPAGHGFTLYRSVNGASNSQIDGFTGNASGNTRRAMVAGSSGEYTWKQENGSFNVIDSSSTGLSYSLGNAIKYTMYNWSASGAGAVHVNRSNRDENTNDDIRSTSTITLMEILA